MDVKKYAPFILLGVGVLAVIGIFFSIRGANTTTPEPTPIVDEIAPEVPFDQRPFVSLTPRTDGHWLKLTMMGINKIPNAKTVDYLLEYLTKEGVNQGVPGMIKIEDLTTIDRDLLLGSESSGKFRYDEGVADGKLTLRFRDSAGKLLGKLTTEFHLQVAPETVLTSKDGMFTYTLDKAPKKGYFVTMQTFGVSEAVEGIIAQGPYGVFTSETGAFPGKITLEGTTLMRLENSKWTALKNMTSPNFGVFLSTN